MTGALDPGAFSLPIGTVTFLLTDIEDSTRHWQRSPESMGAAVARVYALLDDAISAHGGVRPVEQGEGDSVVAAFSRASDALLAARAAQVALHAEPWPTVEPVRVRMAVHTGDATLRDEGNYMGQTIIRTARLRAIAHGGQVVLSAVTRDLTIDQLGSEIELVSLGTHRLKDLARPEDVWQLVDADLPSEFPPLRSLDSVPNNLPVQLSTFVGRLDEIATVATLVRGNRLVTITGTGGAGKTRLSQQVAAEVSDQFSDGAWWVELVDSSEGLAVPLAIAAAIGGRIPSGVTPGSALATTIADRRMLLVLDNCEHVIADIAQLVDELLRACPNLSVLGHQPDRARCSRRIDVADSGAVAAASRDAIPDRRARTVRCRSAVRRARQAGATELRARRRQRSRDRRDLPTARRDSARSRTRRGPMSLVEPGTDPRGFERQPPVAHRRRTNRAPASADTRGVDRLELLAVDRRRPGSAATAVGVRRRVRPDRCRGRGIRSRA